MSQTATTITITVPTTPNPSISFLLWIDAGRFVAIGRNAAV
jgi:hypothetical protein